MVTPAARVSGCVTVQCVWVRARASLIIAALALAVGVPDARSYALPLNLQHSNIYVAPRPLSKRPCFSCTKPDGEKPIHRQYIDLI